MAKRRSGRADRLPVKGSKDPYRRIDKPPGGANCPSCGATVREGRWTWDSPSKNGESVLCPACRRVQDNYPAGYVAMAGSFFRENREEIMNMITNVAENEKAHHPLERIMAVEKGREDALITTTGVHIARRLGDALKRSYQGELSVHYEEGEKAVRVNWNR